MDVLLSDVRYEMCQRCVRYINYEMVPGDIVEFGVYTGRSLAMFAHTQERYTKEVIHACDLKRKLIGLDSFEGLPTDFDGHPRWRKGMFAMNHSRHPTLSVGDAVTADSVFGLFSALSLPKPEIITGDYDSDAVRENLSAVSSAVALVHIDCDLYESTLTALKLIEDKLQEGCIMMFDDWFNYKGNSSKGEQKAVKEWISESQWKLTPYQPYGTFCMSFIVCPK